MACNTFNFFTRFSKYTDKEIGMVSESESSS